MTAQRVIIIGAGIVGACIAYRLSQAGMDVTLVDANARPGQGVSAASFGWINTSSNDLSISPMRYQRCLNAIARYTELDAQLGGRLCLPIRGALVWGGDEIQTHHLAQEHAERGSKLRLIGATEIAQFEPALVEPPMSAIHFPDEKAVDVQKACELLLTVARDNGAEIVLGQNVIGFETAGERVTGVRLAEYVIAADHIVVAAGAQSAQLVEDLMPDHALSTSPAALVTLSVEAGRLNHVIYGSGLEIRSCGNGELIVPEGLDAKADEHMLASLAQDVLGKVRELFPTLVTPQIKRVQIGHRPVILDDRPIVASSNTVQGLYLAVSHPGVILAPEMAELVARALAE